MDAKLRNILEKLTRINRTPFILNEITERQLDIDEGRGNYALIEIDLSDSLVDHEIDFYGDHITIEQCPDNCTMKLNHRKNDNIDLQLIDEIEAPFKKLYLNNTAGSGTLKILVGSKGMFYAKKKINKFADDEKLYFGSGSDYSIYFDGTNFILENQGGTLTTLVTGTTSGDDFQLKTQNAYPYIQLNGNSSTQIIVGAGASFNVKSTTVSNMIKLTYASNITTLEGGLVTGDDLILKCNSINDYPVINLHGNSSIDVVSVNFVKFSVGLTEIFRIGDDGYIQMLECTTPSAIPNYGALYFKADNKLYAQDGAGVEHEVAYV